MRFPACYGFPILVAIVLVVAGCSPPGSGGGEAVADVKIELSLQPSPPKVGEAEATVTITDRDGKPVRGATVKLEGNMNHAGMEPVFADAKESEPGQYKATLKFTMGGDWFVLVTGSLADGKKLKQKIDVPGVKSR